MLNPDILHYLMAHWIEVRSKAFSESFDVYLL